MIAISPEYKAAIQQNFRSEMAFRAVIGIENLLFKSLAVLTDNGHLHFSNVQELKTARRPNLINVTMETGMYILDGTRSLLPATPEYQGFVSDRVSNDSGMFTDPPKITVTTDSYSYDLIGLTLEFDTFHNDYPTDFTINYYFNTQLVKSVPITGNTKAFFVSEERADGINRIEVTFTKTHNANRRLRLVDFVFGVIRIFQSTGRNGIINMSHKTMIHPLMKETPQYELNFEIRDADKDYNPENPIGVWKYMTAKQEARWDYIFMSETIPGGKFYLKNPPTTKNENARFQLTSLLLTLDMLYTEGLYYSGGRTYYDLFSDVFTFAGIPKDASGNIIWHIDERLKNYRCYLPLPILPCHEIIQILCQNTATIPFEDTEGHLYIKYNESVMSGNTLLLTTAYAYPNYDPQLPALRNILFDRHSIAAEANTIELHRSSQFVNGTKQITAPYDASTGQTATVTGGTLVSAKYFAHECLLTITANNATINIVVNGRKLNITTAQRIYPINAIGSDAPISMDLLSDDTLCDALAPVYSKYLQEIKRYKYDYLGDPARRANDLFPINTRFAENLPAQVLSSEYSFNGGSKGVLELKNFG